MDMSCEKIKVIQCSTNVLGRSLKKKTKKKKNMMTNLKSPVDEFSRVEMEGIGIARELHHVDNCYYSRVPAHMLMYKCPLEIGPSNKQIHQEVT